MHQRFLVSGSRLRPGAVGDRLLVPARHFNSPLVATGRAGFHLASAEDIPSGPASFDRVFAVNVIYFWANPHRPLEEVRRVLRPGGFSVIAAVTPETAAAGLFQPPMTTLPSAI